MEFALISIMVYSSLMPHVLSAEVGAIIILIFAFGETDNQRRLITCPRS